MITTLVISNTFEEAQDAFSMFMDFLEKYEPLNISGVFEYSYCVDMYGFGKEDLRYIFIDYKARSMLPDAFDDASEIDEDEFFESILAMKEETAAPKIREIDKN